MSDYDIFLYSLEYSSMVISNSIFSVVAFRVKNCIRRWRFLLTTPIATSADTIFFVGSTVLTMMFALYILALHWIAQLVKWPWKFHSLRDKGDAYEGLNGVKR